MSRIHEALKKAEQERAGRVLAPLDPKAPEPADPGTAAEENLLSTAGGEVLGSSGRAGEDALAQLTQEALKGQVRKFKWNPNPQTMLFFGQEAYAPGTEEFRTLRSHLYAFRDLEPVRTVLVTSAAPREGKSFIVANLAQICVQQPGRRVLLVDADLRWSRLHLTLGTPATPGLSDYLAGEASELSILQRGPLENLYFIPGGKHSSNPAELIANGRLKDLIRRLSPLFDWVFIDSPPVMAVSDSRVIADFCDGLLLVVGAAMQPYDFVQKTCLQFKGKRLLGVVLNRAEARASYGYKYYGYYRGPDGDGDGKPKG